MTNATASLCNFWLWRDFLGKLMSGEPQQGFWVPLTSRHELMLHQFIQEHPELLDFEVIGAHQVQHLARQLQKGELPSLEALVKTFPVDAGLPQANHLMARYTYFLNQVGEPGRLRAEQLGVILQLQRKRAMMQHLENVYSKYDPDSPQAKDFFACIVSLQQTIIAMNRVLESLLRQDSSQGRAVRLMRLNPWLVKMHRWMQNLHAQIVTGHSRVKA